MKDNLANNDELDGIYQIGYEKKSKTWVWYRDLKTRFNLDKAHLSYSEGKGRWMLEASNTIIRSPEVEDTCLVDIAGWEYSTDNGETFHEANADDIIFECSKIILNIVEFFLVYKLTQYSDPFLPSF